MCGALKSLLTLGCGLVPLAAYCASSATSPDPRAEATQATQRVYSQATAGKPWDDRRDFANVERGWVASPDVATIAREGGGVAWAFKDYRSLLQQAPPPTVNPVLWRQVQLNAASGLFKVVDRVYQVRGFDLANMTIVEGDTGIIIIDPLLSVETSRAALALYRQHRGDRPVKAVIYTHSHMDHFGGVKGVVTEEDIRSGRVPVLASRNFLREAISENVTAGNAMQRRTIYFSGMMLPRDAKGSVDAGLGAAVANGTPSFIAPTEEVGDGMVTRTLDGVVFEFHQAPNTEAPSEMILFLPQFGVLNMAEIATHTAHNLLTPRGAQVRSALAWSTAVGEALDRYGDRAEALIGQHHWPTWGAADIRERLSHQRDFYRFVHDQSLHLANSGANMDEIGEALALPAGLAADWALQDYYGTLKGAGKAVYQFYLGWYDGNPANLQKLPAGQSAPRYVAYMGGAQQILARARQDFDAGKYRWVAEVLNQVLFAEPENEEARELQARTFEQLGYQQVSATWRHLYLMAAHELRHGVPAAPVAARPNAYLNDMPSALLLDFAGIALDGQRAAGKRLAVNLTLTDTGESFGWTLGDSVLRHAARASQQPDVVVAMDKASLAALVFRQASLADLVSRGAVRVERGQASLTELVDLLTAFRPDFPLVTP